MAVSTLEDPKARHLEWLESVNEIVAEIADWARDAGWLVHQTKVPIAHDWIRKYVAPGLQLKPPVGHLFVEPLGRRVLGADGRIDLYAWPSHYRVMLIRKGGKWRLRDENGKAWPKAWSRKTFLEVAQILTSKW
jgi:hypothetical protein